MKNVCLALLINTIVAIGSFAQESLSEAVQKNDFLLVKTLVQKGADVNSKDAIGATPLAYVVSSNASTNILDFLLKSGARVPLTEATDESDLTVILWAAASYGRTDQAAYLIACGAKVNGKTTAGTTPLHFAAIGGHLETMRLLVEKGADLSAQTKNELTPLKAALVEKQISAAAWLAQAQGLNVHRCESDVCLATGALAPLVPEMVALRMNVNGPSVPVFRDNKGGSGNMRPAEFSGLFDAGKLLAFGNFNYNNNGNAYLRKSGFLVLPKTEPGQELDDFACMFDVGFSNLIHNANSGDLRVQIQLAEHFAAVGNTNRSIKALNSGRAQVTQLTAFDPQPPGQVATPDGFHIAFIAQQGGKKAVLLDGQPGPKYDRISLNTLRLSDDGKHVAYCAANGENQFIVLDGKSGPTFERLGVPVLSPDGVHFAYVAETGTKAFVILDGQPGPDYEVVGDCTFSPDGKRFAYVAKKDGKMFVVVDGNPGPDYDQTDQCAFSPDGKRLAYIAKKNGKMFVVVDGKPDAQHEAIGGPDLIKFSPDGKHLLYIAIDEQKFSVILDGHPDTECEGLISLPAFSPDGSHVAYVAKKGDKEFLVVDGKWASDYNGFKQPTFSLDGKHMAYRAVREGKQCVVVDGQPGTRYDVALDITFSPNGRRIAYFAENGEKAFAVVDGKPEQEHDYSCQNTLSFSLDGQHVAYAFMSAQKKISIVLDGQIVGSEFDGLNTGGPRFRPDGSLEYIAMKNAVLYRVKHLPLGTTKQ